MPPLHSRSMRTSPAKIERTSPGRSSLDRWLMLACVISVLLVYGRLSAGHFTFLDDRGTGSVPGKWTIRRAGPSINRAPGF